MTTIDRVRCSWSGFNGAPGVSTFYAPSGPELLTPLFDFFTGLVDQVPNDVAVQVQSTGDTLDVATGEVTDIWSGDSQALVRMNSTATYAAPVGILCSWRTGSFVGGRELRGATFIVPASGDQFGTNGQLTTSAVTAVQAACDALVTEGSSNFSIWKRPKDRVGGASAFVVSGGPGNRAAILSSRRD